MHSRFKLIGQFFGLITLISVGCSGQSVPPTPIPTIPLPSPTSVPTATPLPIPSPTPAPTATPEPTGTPASQPQVLFTYSRALQLLEAGFPERAVTDFGLVIRFLPEFAEAYHGRGLAYLALERPVLPLALKDFNRAIELDEDYADAYKNRGAVYFQQEEWDKAKADLEMALSLFDEDLDADEVTEVRALLDELEQ